jgi:hypothetical protein
LLRDQHERTLGNFSVRDIALCRCNFIDAATEMNGAGAPAGFGFPRDRFAKRIIDFKNSGSMPKRF